jgi:hypothetical protein
MSHSEHVDPDNNSETELDRWSEIVHDLQGTCEDLHNFLEQHDAEDLIDNKPFLEYLDNHIFLCDSCGWWAEASEREIDNSCTSCIDEYEEYED